MKKENPAIKYGLIGAIILVTFGIIAQFIALSYLKSAVANPEKISIGTSIVISIGSLIIIIGIFIFCIVMAIKGYRKINTEYSYRKLVNQGLLTTLIIVLVSTAVSYLYNNVISPETKQKTVELTRQVYQNLKIPDDQKEKMLESLDKQNPTRQLLTSFGLTLILGMIISLISASVMNKNKLQNFNQMR